METTKEKQQKPLYRVNLGYERTVGIFRLRLLEGRVGVGEPQFFGNLEEVNRISNRWLRKNK